MILANKERLDSFKSKHPAYAGAIDGWKQTVEAADWSNPQDVKDTFGGRVDFVKKQTVFDVHGNKVRIVTKIVYQAVKIVNVTHVLDHAEYDKEKWKE